MKILNNVFRVLSIVLSVAALVLFFFKFAEIHMFEETVARTGTELAFGAKFGEFETLKSVQILFTLILTAVTVLFSALAWKFKGSRWAAIGFSLFTAIYMLVMALSPAYEFVNTQGYPNISLSPTYVGHMPLFISIALFATFASATAQLLISDAIAVKESKGQLLPIPKRFVRFLRDYKGEITKIVWPGPKAVVKNTLIVLGMCLVFGAFVWLIDWGLGSLIGLLIK